GAPGGQGFALLQVYRLGRDDDAGRYILGEGVIARGGAARDLDIDQAVAHPVAADGFTQYDAQRLGRHGNVDAQLGQAARQPAQVALIVSQPAVKHRPDLIDAVGELKPAILDVDHSLTVRLIDAVYIGDPGHQAPSPSSSPPRAGDTPSDLSLRCSADRSMPMKAAVREILPPKRMICADRYSRSNTSLASRSGRAMMRSALSEAGLADDATSCGSMSAVIGSSAVPVARISRRSTLLRSCRTLPGHGWTCSTARASSAMRRCGSPCDADRLSTKYSTRSLISSGRSGIGGTRIGTTFSRWNKSSRKRSLVIARRRSREVELMTRTST